MVSTPTKHLNPKFKMRKKPVPPLNQNYFSVMVDDGMYFKDLVEQVKQFAGDDFSGGRVEFEYSYGEHEVRIVGHRDMTDSYEAYEVEFAEYNKWVKEHVSEIAAHKAELKKRSDVRKRKEITEKETRLQKELEQLRKEKRNFGHPI